MPKMTFTDENRVKSQYDFNKFSLEKGERARVSCIEGEPEYQFVHTLRAPQIVNGKAVMETQNFRNKDGSTEAREVMKTDFIGQHICVGDINILADQGVDVQNCPVCKASKESDAVQGPQRRFAMNILRYKTQVGSFLIQDPFNIEIVTWSFTDSRFNTLIDLTKEWGNLQTRDLNIGPCESKQYQKYDINMAGECEWQKSDARMEQVKLAYKNNKLENLDAALGRRLTREQVEEDLSRVLSRYEIAMGRKVDGTIIDVAPAVDVSSLLGDTPVKEEPKVQDTVPTPAVTEAPDPTPGSSADPLAEFAAPLPQEQKDEPKKADAMMSLQDILDL
jgi:hypothetical protein